MAPRSRPRPGSKFPVYRDDVLDRITEAAGGLPHDDREVDILTGIEPTGERRYERAIGREALRPTATAWSSVSTTRPRATLPSSAGTARCTALPTAS